MQQLFQDAAEEETMQQAAGSLNGVVKSWNGLKGYGFITSEGIAGDVLFGRNELPEDAKEVRGAFLEGRPVTFDAQESADGRVKATSVQIVAVEGRPLAGVIKSFSEKNGYGFVTSSSLSEDVRFQRQDLQGVPPGTNLKGELVTFEMQALPDGKLRVSRIQFQSSKIADRVRSQAGIATFVSAAPAISFAPQTFAPQTFVPQPAVAQAVVGTLSGTVKSYNEAKGYGFLNLPGQPVDIKFGRTDVVGNVVAGSQVSFVLAISPDGRVQAQQVTATAAPVQLVSAKRPAGAMAVAAPLVAGGGVLPGRAPKLQKTAVTTQGVGTPTGQFASGTIKSYNSSKGFGFISSTSSQGDIFFMRTALPAEAQVQGLSLVGQQVTFELFLSADNKLRAQGITLG